MLNRFRDFWTKLIAAPIARAAVASTAGRFVPLMVSIWNGDTWAAGENEVMVGVGGGPGTAAQTSATPSMTSPMPPTMPATASPGLQVRL